MSATGIGQHCRVASGLSVELLAFQLLCVIFPACGIALGHFIADAAMEEFAWLYCRIQADQYCHAFETL